MASCCPAFGKVDAFCIRWTVREESEPGSQRECQAAGNKRSVGAQNDLHCKGLVNAKTAVCAAVEAQIYGGSFSMQILRPGAAGVKATRLRRANKAHPWTVCGRPENAVHGNQPGTDSIPAIRNPLRRPKPTEKGRKALWTYKLWYADAMPATLQAMRLGNYYSESYQRDADEH